MKRANVKADRLAAIFLFGFALFNYPFLAIFNHARLVLGVPLLFLYLFLAWGAVIALAALTASGPEDP